MYTYTGQRDGHTHTHTQTDLLPEAGHEVSGHGLAVRLAVPLLTHHRAVVLLMNEHPGPWHQLVHLPYNTQTSQTAVP